MPPVLGRGFPQRTLADLRRHASLHCGCGSFPGSRTTTRTRRRTYPTTHARVPVQGREGELDRPRSCGQNWLPGLTSGPLKPDSLRPKAGAPASAASPSETPLMRGFVVLAPWKCSTGATTRYCVARRKANSVEHCLLSYTHRHSRDSPGAIQVGQGRAGGPPRRGLALTLLDGSEHPAAWGRWSALRHLPRAEPAKGRAAGRRC